MMTPNDWNEALRPDRDLRERYDVIANVVRTFLVGGGAIIGEGEMLSTNDLVEALYPARYVRTDAGHDARKLLFRALSARVLGKHALADCMTFGPERSKFGKAQRPALWHAPFPVEYCEKCGQALPVDVEAVDL